MLCDPCAIKFDFIGKYETLGEDAIQVLRQLHINATFPKADKGANTNTESAILKRYYSKIPKQITDKIVDVYKKDFQLFGYDSNISHYLDI